ncbi:OmpA family protein [Chitinophaga nivalis]|uniref:OmpA family protein n=1 Tax=Chitinophaga nivalis TaxID=2991709 RepID=A0ABT3IJJ7_9BACT|nr:OmpA family protein [Chitinophaga nivalis]MCW3466164.1 OmpA family protein [Chitinophaga nivalis]MCW3484145.1 OmpA family protein [Chitinophaga nivalis]
MIASIKRIPQLLLILAATGYSQQTSAQYAYTEAQQAYQLYNFEKAKPLFEKAYHKKATAKAARGAADSYRLTKDYKQAAIWYAHLWETKEFTPADELHYAGILMNNQQYAAALTHLDHYLQMNPDSRLAQQMKSGCLLGNAPLDIVVKGELENMAALNSPYSDWSITKFKEQYIFASDRPYKDIRKSGFFEPEDIKKKKYTWTGNSYLHLYETNGDSTQIKPLEKHSVNGDYHSSNATYNANGTTLFIAVTTLERRPSSALGKDSILTMHIGIKEVTRNQKEQWALTAPLPFNATLQYAVGDPWINPGGDTLYFVANQGAGHQGGTDIYYAVKNNNNWSSPINMGAIINTPGNERTPFFDNTGNLFFASDGHPGLGGLDIFKAVNKNEQWHISHAGIPINSSHDDFAAAILDSALYFASNREGGKGSDDIYRFVPAPAPVPPRPPVFVISGIVTDRVTHQPLPGVQVTLLNHVTDQVIKVTTNDDGYYTSPVDSGRYDMSYLKSRYITIPKDTVSVQGYTSDVTIHRDQQMDQPQLHKPIRIDNIYFDLGKADIRPDAAKELDKLVTILTDNPTWEIELSAHTDARANDAFNMTLSKRRATATVAYLVSKGIKAGRLTAKGYGETKLLNKCANGVKCTEAEHLRNRRLEFMILKS